MEAQKATHLIEYHVDEWETHEGVFSVVLTQGNFCDTAIIYRHQTDENKVVRKLGYTSKDFIPSLRDSGLYDINVSMARDWFFNVLKVTKIERALTLFRIYEDAVRNNLPEEKIEPIRQSFLNMIRTK